MKNSVIMLAVVFSVFCLGVGHAQTMLGNYTSHSVNGNQVNFVLSDNSKVRVELCKSDIARIRVAIAGADFIANEPYIVVKYDWPPVGATVSDEGKYIRIATGEMVIRANKTPFRLDFYDASNTTAITTQTNDIPMAWDGITKTLSFNLDAAGIQEHIYGCGMQYAYFDLRGQNIDNWQILVSGKTTRENLTGQNEPVNPYYWSTAGYGILLHNSYRSSFDFGKANASRITWQLTEGELDFYFFRGPSIKKIMRCYCDVTGFADLPPKTALGLHYRGWGHPNAKPPDPVGTFSAADYDHFTDTFRLMGIPCDYIATEPGWASMWGGLKYEPAEFPDPAGWCGRMTEKGFKPNHWMYGAIRDTELIVLLKDYLGTDRRLDFTMEKGLDLYFDWLKKYHFDLGVTGFKDDEHGGVNPNVNLKSGGDKRQYRNSYHFILYDQIYKRYKAAYNRRGYVMWFGDLYTGAQRWPALCYTDGGIQIKQAANSGWTGVSYGPEFSDWHPFSLALHSNAFAVYWVDNEWKAPYFPWSNKSEFAPYLQYLKLHYSLIPYIYSHIWEQHNTGVGPIRPLPLEFQDDPNTYAIGLQYFYGKNLMIAFDKSSIYLPEGKWIYYWDGQVYNGKQTINKLGTPDTECAVFARGGAIIPMMPEMNYVDEKPLDPLIVDIYGQGSSDFTLYEDDGMSFNYEKGDYCETRYENNNGTAITINARKIYGQYTPSNRSYLFRIHSDADPEKIYLNSKGLPEKTSEAELLASKYGWYYSNGIVEVMFPDDGKLNRLGIGNPVSVKSRKAGISTGSDKSGRTK